MDRPVKAALSCSQRGSRGETNSSTTVRRRIRSDGRVLASDSRGGGRGACDKGKKASVEGDVERAWVDSDADSGVDSVVSVVE